jgi:hypothetical protein
MNSDRQGDAFDLPESRWAILLVSMARADSRARQGVPIRGESSLYVSDVSQVHTLEDLLGIIAADFAVPGPMGDLDAVLSRLSDIDWAPNPAGFVWQIQGLSTLWANDIMLAKHLVAMVVHLCDRGRSAEVPFRIVLQGDGATLDDVRDQIALEFRRFRDSPYSWVDFEEPAVLEKVAGGWQSVDLSD